MLRKRDNFEWMSAFRIGTVSLSSDLEVELNHQVAGGAEMRRFVTRQKFEFSLVRPEIELLTRLSGTSEI